MTTVKELREFLASLPNETEVSIKVTVEHGYSAYSSEVPFSVEDHTEVIDLRNSHFVKEEDLKRVYLTLGE